MGHSRSHRRLSYLRAEFRRLNARPLSQLGRFVTRGMREAGVAMEANDLSHDSSVVDLRTQGRVTEYRADGYGTDEGPGWNHTEPSPTTLLDLIVNPISSPRNALKCRPHHAESQFEYVNTDKSAQGIVRAYRSAFRQGSILRHLVPVSNSCSLPEKISSRSE